MLGLIYQLPMMVMMLLTYPQGQVAIVVVLLAVAAAAASRRFWVQCFVAILLFVLSTVASVWVLQFGWAFAVLGILLLMSGAVWKLTARRPAESQPVRAHASGGLIWPGLGLLAAPFANVFLLMPALRPFFA